MAVIWWPAFEMTLDHAASRDALAAFLRRKSDARAVEIEELHLLSGGTLQENWLLVARYHGGSLDGRQRFVLRTDAMTKLGMGLDRAGEFAVLRAVHAAGIMVPEPILLESGGSVIGKPFFLTRRIEGSALAPRIVAGEIGGDREALAERLGRELARIHRITPPRAELAILGAPSGDAAQTRIAEHRRFLLGSDEPFPVAEWALRWLMHHSPSPVPPVLCHGDFRTGNYLVDAGGLAAILDWEFARWGDPDEDIGWFCSRCWRFGADHREAGGIAPRAAFYGGYEAESGRRIDPLRARYWEVMAALRRLIIAVRQRDRVLIGGERSLNLALIGRRVAECELELLLLTEASEDME